jgi:hypothetical protein
MPKFVGDWLRGTNVTGRLRSNKAPNKLIQDLEWRYMLCAACERRFSVFEGEVCEKIFLPIHERRQDRFRYGPSFARFAVSVAWRALVALKREGGLGHLNEIPDAVDAAEVVWRKCLLNERSTPAPHVVHALPMDVPTNLDPKGISPHYSRFILRTPAIGHRCFKGAGYVIVKMARLIVIGTVASGNERKDWKATQLHFEAVRGALRNITSLAGSRITSSLARKNRGGSSTSCPGGRSSGPTRRSWKQSMTMRTSSLRQTSFVPLNPT